jgi:hypothetical protein
MAKTLKQIKLLQRWIPLLFALAMMLLIISAWQGPLSVGYLIRALIIGLDFSVLTIANWRWKSNYANSLIWPILSIVLLIGGFYWSKDQTFGSSKAESYFWSLAGQFMSTVSAVFLVALSASSRKLRKTYGS